MEEDTLATYLDALSRDDCYRVQSILKNDNHETTEVVFFTGKGGAELGPFIRKRINRDAGMGQAYRELLEVQKLGKRFLHLPRIYDVHDRDNELIVIMEYVAGRTLHDEVYERDASFGLASELFPILCDGVIELHEGLPSPVIHRDLKPTNIIISKNGLTIIDFGIARTYHADANSDTTQFGTRAYAPPEQFGYGQTDVRSDVYALGMILYYLLREANPDPTIVNSGFPLLGSWPQLRAVVRKATAFDPAGRYQNVRELKQAFVEAADKERHRVNQFATSVTETIDATTLTNVVAANLSVATKDATAASAPYEKGAVTTPVPSNQVQTNLQKPHKDKASSSEILGLVWDSLIGLIWLFIMGMFIAIVVMPPESVPAYPAWFLVLEYPLFAGLIVTGASYGLMDKRWLRRHVPFMRNQTFGRSLIVAGLLFLAAIVALFVLILIVAATGNFGIPT